MNQNTKGVLILAIIIFLMWLILTGSKTYRLYGATDDRYISQVQEYERAVSNSEPWTNDPEKIALFFAGYPNIDGIIPDKVKVTDNNEGEVSILVMTDNLMDDSVKAKEIKVELRKQEGFWDIVSVAGRWKCQRGRSWSFGWVTNFCS